MTSFSFRGRNLPELIPMIFALTEPGHTVYLISPWLNINATLDLSWKSDGRKISIFDFIISEKKRGVSSKFYVSTKAEKDFETQNSLKILLNSGFQVEVVKELHSKAIVGASLMYEGSANITLSGLYNNKESATISTVENQDSELRRLLS